MIITPLGHTEFLVDIANSEGENIRILVDSWLSDYAIGDMMERIVKVQLDREKIDTIDAIYISHSHTDHLDPYTLMEIYTHASPILLLPFTLAYLEPLLHGYLPKAEIVILKNHETYTLRGIEISGHMWSHPDITNEDDVMMLSVASEKEFLFAEIDSEPDGESLEVAKSLYRLMTKHDYESVLYIASRNVLEAALPVLELAPSKRASFRGEFIAREKEDMIFSYEKYDYEEFATFPKLFEIPGFTRGFIGQGIAYPESLSEELFSYQIFPLPEIASLESDLARERGYEFVQKALTPGRQYRVEKGTIEQGRKECAIGEFIKSDVSIISGDTSFLSSRQSSSVSVTNEERSFSEQDFSPAQKQQIRNDRNSGERLYASGPLFPRDFSESDIALAKVKILEILSSRFLPYWSASPVASLRDALIKNDGVYRISFSLSSRRDPFQNQVGEKDSQNLLSEGKSDSSVSLRNDSEVYPVDKTDGEILFEYSTARTGFIEVPYTEKMHIDEDYYLADILDFLEGRQEMYSSFWHRLDPKRAYRLWTCLGANYMNHDLVEKKYRLHFERAKNGLTVNDFVEGVLGTVRNGSMNNL